MIGTNEKSDFLFAITPLYSIHLGNSSKTIKMSKENIRQKKKGSRSIMRRVRSHQSKNKRVDLSSSNTDEESTMSTQNQSTPSTHNVDDFLGFYLNYTSKMYFAFFSK